MSASFDPPVGSALHAVDGAADVVYDDCCVVIEGVVSPMGQCGWPGRENGYDVHCFGFAGWRRPDESLVECDLTLLRPVPPSLGGQNREENVFERFPPYSIARLSVLLSKDQKRAVVERALTIGEPDQELLLLSQRLRQAVEISTEHFGVLVLNRKINWFEGKAEWNGKRIDINFETDEGIGDAIKTAECLWSDQAIWKHQVDEFAVKELLPLKNESWLGEGESELTVNDFMGRMDLVSITVGGEGRFEFWHVGDLFGGHAIEISGNLEAGITDADTPG